MSGNSINIREIPLDTGGTTIRHRRYLQTHSKPVLPSDEFVDIVSFAKAQARTVHESDIIEHSMYLAYALAKNECMEDV